MKRIRTKKTVRKEDNVKKQKIMQGVRTGIRAGLIRGKGM